MSKSKNLIKLKNKGYMIPSFIVITNIEELEVKKNLLDTSKLYAVRSSADIEDGDKFSFAGIFNSYLNVHFEMLEEMVKKCLDLRYCENLDDYLHYFNIYKKIEMEVIVQEMINCQVSGVAFSVNPENMKEEIIIEAVWGLGSGLVSGKYVPDRIVIKNSIILNYVTSFQELMLVCKNTNGIGEVFVKYIDQSRKKLNPHKIQKILKLIESLKKYYSKPFEVEWGFYEEKLYLFQVRAITNIENRRIQE